MVTVILQPDKRSLIVDFSAAALDRPVIGVFAVQMRGRAAEEIHRQRYHARKMESHAAARRRLVQRLARERAEVLEQKTMPARRGNAAADFVARQFLALKDYRFGTGVGEPLGRGRRGQAGPDGGEVNWTH